MSKRSWLTKYSLTSEERAGLLAAIPNTGRMMEVGTWVGASVRFFAERRPLVQFMSIDPLVRAGGAKALGAWHERQMPNTNLFLGTTQHYARLHDSPRFDIILIDGDHSKDGCLVDLLLCKDWLSPNGQLVAHDYHSHRPQTQGPTEAVDWFCVEYGWRVARTVGMLAFLETPDRAINLAKKAMKTSATMDP